MTTICDEIKLALNEAIEYESENLKIAGNKFCYLIAKDINNAGCVALKVIHGRELTEFKRMLTKNFSCDNIEFITISRSCAYREYEPYKFVNSKEDFIHAVHTKLNNTPKLV